MLKTILFEIITVTTHTFALSTAGNDQYIFAVHTRIMCVTTQFVPFKFVAFVTITAVSIFCVRKCVTATHDLHQTT